MTLIGLTGFKGSGKDTVARFLVQQGGFKRYAFADPLKEAVAAMLRWPVEALHSEAKDQLLPGRAFQPEETPRPLYFRTPRDILQRLGTEVIREQLGPDFWIWCLEQRLREDAPERVVVTDARFLNEADWIRRRGRLWHIHRPSLQSGAAPEHASDQGLEPQPEEVEILNDKTVRALEQRVLQQLNAEDLL